MIDMILAVQGGDVRASKCASALVAQQVKSSEVIRLAQGILALTAFVFSGKEL